MNLSAEQWWTLILVPLAVSIVANLVTPAIKRLISVVGRHSAQRTGNLILRVRLEQLRDHVAKLTELRDNAEARELALQGALKYAYTALCILIVGAIAAVTLRNLAVFLPAPLDDPAIFPVVIIGAILGAGPLQAAVYAVRTLRLLRAAKDTNGPIAKLSAQIETIEVEMARNRP